MKKDDKNKTDEFLDSLHQLFDSSKLPKAPEISEELLEGAWACLPQSKLDSNVLELKPRKIKSENTSAFSNDSYLAFAAAAADKSKAIELTSQSGEWNLSIKQSRNNPNQGHITATFLLDNAEAYEGRHLRIYCDGEIVFAGKITAGLVKGKTNLANLDLTKNIVQEIA